MAASGITSHSYNKAYPTGFPIQEPQYIQARGAAMQRSPWDQTQLPLGEALYELSTSTASSPGPCQQQQQQREQQRQMEQHGDEELDGSGSTPTSKSYNEPSLAGKIECGCMPYPLPVTNCTGPPIGGHAPVAGHLLFP